jgi:hypothetical protein
MPSLEILDISRNKLKRLPSKPGSLTNLRVCAFLFLGQTYSKHLYRYLGIQLFAEQGVQAASLPEPVPPPEHSASRPKSAGVATKVSDGVSKQLG